MTKNVFVGRKTELSILNSLFEEANSGLAKLVLINGSAGIGKSGMIRKFIENIQNGQNIITAITECNDKEGINAYSPFKDLLLKLNSQLIAGNYSATFNKLKQFVSDAGVQWISFIPMVGGIAAASIETYKAYQKSFVKKNQPEIFGETDVYRIFESELRRLAENKTIVIFLDDIQWADSSSLNLLFALAKNIRENPFKIMIIAAFRPAEIEAGRNKISESGENITVSHPLCDKIFEMKNYTKQETHIKRTDKWFSEIIMQPISRQESDLLINERFYPQNFSSDFFEKIYDLSNGHLLFINEILNFLSEKGKIKLNSNNIYQLSEINFEQMPMSISAIIDEKIQRLDEDLKKIISYASVNGNEFLVQIVEKILNIDELQLLDYLEILNKKHGLIIAESPIKINNILFELYRFSQTLVQKQIYENIDAAKRRALHRKIAEIMKHLYSSEIETNKEIREQYILHNQIGQGLIDGISYKIQTIKNISEKTEFPEADLDAAKEEIKKIEESSRQFALDEAFIHIDKALAFLSGNSTNEAALLKLETYHFKSKLQFQKGFYSDSLETARKLLKLSQEISNENYSSLAYIKIGEATQALGNYEDAIIFYKYACNICIDLENYELLIKTYNNIGTAKDAQTAYDDGILYFEKALEINQVINNEINKAETLMLMADSYRKKGLNEKAIENYEKAQLIFEKNEDIRNIGMVLNKKGLSILNKGDYDIAIKIFLQSLEISKNQNDIVNNANRLNNLGLVYENKGDYKTAIEYYEKCLTIDKSLNDKPKMAITMNNIGATYSLIGNYEQSFVYFDKSMKIYSSIEDLAGISLTSACMANSLYLTGKNEEARKYFTQSLDIDIKLNDKVNIANNYNGLANTYYSENNYQTAYEYYNKSIEIYKENKDDLSVATISINIANIKYLLGEYSEAIKVYNKSLEIFENTDDKLNTALIHVNLGNLYNHLNNFQETVFNYKIAIQLYNETESLEELSSVYYSLGLAQKEADNYWEALENLKEAKRLLKELELDTTDVKFKIKELEKILRKK